MFRRVSRAGSIALGLTLIVGAPLAGQIDAVSPQLSFGDADLGLGVRFGFDASGWHPDVEIQLGLDIFFPDTRPGVDLGYFEINANVVRHFRIADNRTLMPYAGGGFNVARASSSEAGVSFSERSKTDLGVNILGGLRLDLDRYDPFFELRFELGGGDQGVITAGLRIPT